MTHSQAVGVFYYKIFFVSTAEMQEKGKFGAKTGKKGPLCMLPVKQGVKGVSRRVYFFTSGAFRNQRNYNRGSCFCFIRIG